MVATSSRFRVRLVTVLVIVAIAFLAVGVVYVTQPAHALPSFFPGHQAGASRNHTKHGVAAFVVAAIALLGAWLSTGPGTANG